MDKYDFIQAALIGSISVGIGSVTDIILHKQNFESECLNITGENLSQDLATNSENLPMRLFRTNDNGNATLDIAVFTTLGYNSKAQTEEEKLQFVEDMNNSYKSLLEIINSGNERAFANRLPQDFLNNDSLRLMVEMYPTFTISQYDSLLAYAKNNPDEYESNIILGWLPVRETFINERSNYVLKSLSNYYDLGEFEVSSNMGEYVFEHSDKVMEEIQTLNSNGQDVAAQLKAVQYYLSLNLISDNYKNTKHYESLVLDNVFWTDSLGVLSIAEVPIIIDEDSAIDRRSEKEKAQAAVLEELALQIGLTESAISKLKYSNFTTIRELVDAGELDPKYMLAAGVHSEGDIGLSIDDSCIKLNISIHEIAHALEPSNIRELMGIIEKYTQGNIPADPSSPYYRFGEILRELKHGDSQVLDNTSYQGLWWDKELELADYLSGELPYFIGKRGFGAFDVSIPAETWASLVELSRLFLSADEIPPEFKEYIFEIVKPEAFQSKPMTTPLSKKPLHGGIIAFISSFVAISAFMNKFDKWLISREQEQ